MKRKTIPTGKLTRMEWLQLRRKGIGGSDASVVMGKNPYRSILQLWEEKTDKLPVTDSGNEYTYWGNVMEPIIRKEFMNRTGIKVRQKHAMIFHPDYPYLFADVDGIATDERGEKCIFEAKTASQYKEEQWENEVPEEYVLQVQHYLAVCGMNKAYVAALIGGNKFVFHTIYRDEAVITELIRKEREFWEQYVITGKEPPADASEATKDYLDKKFSDTVTEASIQLQDSMKEILSEYQEVDSKVKELEEQKRGLANQIKAAMGEYEVGEVDGTVVSWKKISRKSLDSTKLRKELPKVFESYCSTTSYRKLSIA